MFNNSVANITKDLAKTVEKLEDHANTMTIRAYDADVLIDTLCLQFAKRFNRLVDLAQRITDAVETFVDRRIEKMEEACDQRIEKLEARIAEARAEAEKARSVSAKINNLLS